MSMLSPKKVLVKFIEIGEARNEEDAYKILNKVHGPLPSLEKLKEMSAGDYLGLVLHNLLDKTKDTEESTVKKYNN